jgi:hypothetical protein
MKPRHLYLLCILAGLAWLGATLRSHNTRESRARAVEAKEAQTAQWQKIAAELDALPGINVSPLHDLNIMAVYSSGTLPDYEARKFVQAAAQKLGYPVMVRLRDDTGKILATSEPAF